MRGRGKSDDFEGKTAAELNSMLRFFYAEAKTKSGRKYSKPALIGIRAALNRYLRNPPYHREFNLMTDQSFSSSNQVLAGIVKTMKRAGQDKSKHHEPIAQADLVKLRNSRALGYGSPLALQRKVYFDISYHFGRRGREGLRQLSKQSFVVKADPSGLRYVVPAFREKEKNHANDNFQKQARMYATPDDKERCPMNTYLYYISKLHPSHNALFQRPKPAIPAEGPWYNNAPLGIKTLGNMMAQLSKEAGLSSRYTNHCIRATTCVQLDRAGYETQQIMAITGHRNEASVRSYTDRMYPERAREISHTLSRCPPSKPIASSAPQKPQSAFREVASAPLQGQAPVPIAEPDNDMPVEAGPGVEAPDHHHAIANDVAAVAPPVPMQIQVQHPDQTAVVHGTPAPMLFSNCVFHGNVTVHLPK